MKAIHNRSKFGPMLGALRLVRGETIVRETMVIIRWVTAFYYGAPYR